MIKCLRFRIAAEQCSRHLVVVSFEDYQRLTSSRRSIADSLAMPDAADIEFEPQPVSMESRPLAKTTSNAP